jgi:hypothetical protein
MSKRAPRSECRRPEIRALVRKQLVIIHQLRVKAGEPDFGVFVVERRIFEGRRCNGSYMKTIFD